ncbi:MAG: glycosyltransferase family 39 protein [Gloeomargarita sp. GMQP_bins_120]
MAGKGRQVVGWVILSFIFFLLGNGTLSFTSLDEGRNMDAVQNMLKTLDFISPVYNCQPRFEKPPLLYWLVALSSLVFGLNEFAARLVSGLAATGVSLVTYFIAEGLYGEKIATKSLVILMTIPHLWILSRSVIPEMLNTFFALLGLYLFLQEQFVGGWISLALAFLTKGPVGVILVLGIYWLWQRDRRILNPTGLLAFCVLGLPWYLAMVYRHGYGYLYQFFIYENFMRYTGQWQVFSFPFYYYFIIVLLATIFYWPLYPKLVHHFRREWFPLVLWAGLVIGFFSLSRNKVHHYILLAYPPLAILLAQVAGRVYLRIAVTLAVSLVIFSQPILHWYEQERLVPRAYPILADYPGQVSFYKAEDSALVFYSQRCIPKVNRAEEAAGLVITKEKHLPDLHCQPLLKGKEYDTTYVLCAK